jgi:endonuclease/exonuclease/phosphatase (EEP) superfamily protein YafD
MRLLVFLALVVALLLPPDTAEGAQVCTYNTHVTLPAGVVHRDLVRLAPRCGLLGLQEAWHRPTRTLRLGPAWGLARAQRAPGTPITWRRAWWAYQAQGAVLGHRSHLFPSATRWATWVRLRHRPDGAVVTVVNWHAIPHVEQGGRPRALPRLALYRLGMIRLGRLVESAARHGSVLVLGDFNVDARRDQGWRYFPRAWAPRHRLTTVWRALGVHRGTLGRRAVDYTMDRGPWRPVSRYVLGLHSDHRALVVRYRVQP